MRINWLKIPAALAALAASFASASLFRRPRPPREQTHRGYYRFPAVHGDTLVFTSEGDLWTVGIHGGAAQRLTTSPGMERFASISPDGKIVAFQANYEGPDEVYTMPVTGGLPERRTWDGDASPAGWTPDGRLMIVTRRYSTLPAQRLVLVDLQGKREIVPLAEAAEAAYSSDGHTVFFTRWGWQGSSTKRYKGGTIENLWRFDGQNEAVPLTADYEGTSAHPMFFQGRVYFLSDRDGVMNVWSMDPDGKDLKEESHQHFFDVKSASVSDGHVVYASAGDLWVLDLASGHEEVIPITLSSDFDQLREHWVKKPLEYLTAAHIAPDGSSAVFTARGEVFTMPAKTGRTVKVAGNSAIRYREARFMPDGKSILALSTDSGEAEFWKYPVNGVGKPEQWTSDAKVLRLDGVVSPDGHWLAHFDKQQQLWIFDIKTKQQKRIAQSMNGDFGDLTWSPDSQWLAYTENADNSFQQIKLFNANSGVIQAITSERFNDPGRAPRPRRRRRPHPGRPLARTAARELAASHPHRAPRPRPRPRRPRPASQGQRRPALLRSRPHRQRPLRALRQRETGVLQHRPRPARTRQPRTRRHPRLDQESTHGTRELPHRNNLLDRRPPALTGQLNPAVRSAS